MNKLKNKIISLLKIWYRDSRMNIAARQIFESIIEYALYYWFFYTIFDNNYLSLAAVLLTSYIKYVSKNISINRQKFLSGEFDSYLLKPFSPMVSTLFDGLLFVDLSVLLFVLLIMAIVYANYLLITISIIILIAGLYLISRSLLILNSSYQILDKLSLLAILVIFSLIYKPLGDNNFNFVFQLGITIFSSFVFYLSIKLWQKVIQKYIRH